MGLTTTHNFERTVRMATGTVIQRINIGPYIKAARVVSSSLHGFEADDVVFIKEGGALTPGCVCVVQQPTLDLVLLRYASESTLTHLPEQSAVVGVVYQLQKARF